MHFRIWCRWGELPLDSTDEEAAIEEAVAYAMRNGKFVVLIDEDRNEVLQIAPALQTDMVTEILFGDAWPGLGSVTLN
jgi:hypothetical protein